MVQNNVKDKYEYDPIIPEFLYLLIALCFVSGKAGQAVSAKRE